MSKVCFLIPVYPPHYHFLDFLNKLVKPLDFDIYFVLSFTNDAAELAKYNYNNVYNLIILEDYIDKEMINNIISKNIIITFKKYFGLNFLKNNYQYIATLDCEIDFINTNNIFDKFHNFCNKKQIIGSKFSENHEHYNLLCNINKSSSCFFDCNPEYINKLNNITHNFSVYFWFSDIPIYDMSILPEYLKFIEFENYNSFINKIDWYCFDYIPYCYYCFLFKEYSLLNIKDYNINREWSLESMPIETYKKVCCNIGYTPLWVIQNTYNENKEFLNNSDTFMYYHRNDGRYFTKND